MATVLMTRLMCSKDQREVEDLKSKLFRAGIRSEVSVNPLASALGVLRLEIHIHDSDYLEASRIHKEFLATRNGDPVSESEEAGGGAQSDRKELPFVVEPLRSPPAKARLQPPALPEPSQAGEQEIPGGDLAEAAALLEKEIEDVLAGNRDLEGRCSTLQDQVKALEASLAQAQEKMAQQSSDHSAVEQRLEDANAARTRMEKELDGANKHFKSAELSLQKANEQIESQARELKQQQAKADALRKEIASKDDQLGKLSGELSQTRAKLENEKELRQAAEQKASDHAAARKLLEQQVTQFSELQSELHDQQQHDREQIQYCFQAVTKLRGRLNQKKSALTQKS